MCRDATHPCSFQITLLFASGCLTERTLLTVSHRCALSLQPNNVLNVQLLTSHAVCRSPRNDLPCLASMPDQLHMCRKLLEGRDMQRGQDSVVRLRLCTIATRMLVVSMPLLS